jgi:hypothetical protein
MECIVGGIMPESWREHVEYMRGPFRRDLVREIREIGDPAILEALAVVSGMLTPIPYAKCTIRDEANVLTAATFQTALLDALDEQGVDGMERTFSQDELRKLMTETSAALERLLWMKQETPDAYDDFLHEYNARHCQGWERGSASTRRKHRKQ